MTLRWDFPGVGRLNQWRNYIRRKFLVSGVSGKSLIREFMQYQMLLRPKSHCSTIEQSRQRGLADLQIALPWRIRLMCRERCLPGGISLSINTCAWLSLIFAGKRPRRLVIRNICVSMGKTGRLAANRRTQAAVFGPIPLSEVRKSRASSRFTVRKNERSRSPRRDLISLSTFLMTTDFVLARPPDWMAAAIVEVLARLTESQSENRSLRLSNARRLFVSLVDCERIVPINSSRTSSRVSIVGIP